MDRDTLIAPQSRWGREPTPTAARPDRPTLEEAGLYGELVEDLHGESVRLEQERLDWRWVPERLPYEPLPPLVTLVLLDLEGHGSPPLGEVITARGGRPIR